MKCKPEKAKMSCSGYLLYLSLLVVLICCKYSQPFRPSGNINGESGIEILEAWMPTIKQYNSQ